MDQYRNKFIGNNVCPPEVITLGSLYSKDLPNGFILPERPSTFNRQAKFLNDERYVVHDIPPWPVSYIEYLKPVQLCLIASDELPLLLRYKPDEKLQEHWRRWLPFFPEAKKRDLSLTGTQDNKLVTLYPLQWLPKNKHAVDPDIHHKLLSKLTIPEMGALCPYHMDLQNYTVPCIIKVTHGLSGKGTYLASTKDQAEQIIKKIQNEMECPEPSISAVVENITENYCVQFYLYKIGDIKWLGCSKQLVGDNFSWNGGFVDWDEQESLKKRLYDTVMPVKNFLHKNGYFGVVGIDVLSNKEGKETSTLV